MPARAVHHDRPRAPWYAAGRGGRAGVAGRAGRGADRGGPQRTGDRAVERSPSRIIDNKGAMRTHNPRHSGGVTLVAQHRR